MLLMMLNLEARLKDQLDHQVHNKFATISVFFLCLLNIVPPLFDEGGIFDVDSQIINNCGLIEHVRGVYFDNVYYTILSLFFVFIGFSIPFVFYTLSNQIKRLSNLIGGWFFAGLTIEIINFNFPTRVLNSSGYGSQYAQWLIMFVIGLVFIIVSETWNTQKKLRQL